MAKKKKKKGGIIRKIKRLIILSVLAVIGILALLFFGLNAIIKKGIETVGPQATQCTVDVGSVFLLPFMGSGSISNLTIGNPKGYDTPNAVYIGKASLTLEPNSLMEDKIIIRTIEVIAPEITYEGNNKSNNLSTIVDNINDYVEKLGLATDDDKIEKPTPLQIDNLYIVDAIVKLEIPIFKGKTINFPLADIHLKDLGQGPKGITGGEVASIALKAILKQTSTAIPRKIAEFTKNSLNFGNSGTDTVKKGVGSIFDILKRD